MQSENIFIVHPTTADQINALMEVVKTFKIKFEISNEKPYNAEFVAKILQGDEDLKAGKGRKVTLDELDSLWK